MKGKESVLNTTKAAEHFIVAIGASAGGLEPIHQLFDSMPVDSGMSFILIQHLSPDHKSLMREILGKHTAMPVLEAEDGMVLERDRIYLIPNRKVATLEGARFRLNEKEKVQIPNMAIDTFFASLAQEKKEHAVGIILSGSGSDGCKGIEAIKKEGGWVVVQDPATAEFDSMPLNAVNAGVADLVLAPEMMAEELVSFLSEPLFMRKLSGWNQQEEETMANIISYLKDVTPHDFSQYKKPTIKRRLAKRAGEKGFRSINEYQEYLRANAEEPLILAKEFLINVTRFFRDPEGYEELRTKVIPALFANRKPNDTIKIWVVACSTGEEAYSLAILFNEYMEHSGNEGVNIKIFATDIDKDAIQTAAAGLYPDYIARDISSEYLTQYFVKEGNYYRIIPSLRKMIVFAAHDVTKDPPFSKIDLISCRNLLIYMTPSLQKNVFRTFLFSIQTGGMLFLGSSENPGPISDSLREISKKWKIYQCTGKHKGLNTEPLPGVTRKMTQKSNKPKNALSHLDEIFRDTLTEEFQFAGILVDESLEVKHAIGNFKDFMIFPENNFTFNLLKLVEQDLAIALGSCTRKALHENTRTVMRQVKVGEGPSLRHVTIMVKPYLHQQQYQQSFLFIILRQEEPSHAPLEMRPEGTTSQLENERMQLLENELRETKESLQTLIEELESANEELMTSNEEMISANEELQSTNEELQSINEELHTVSAEHQLKIRELVELNDDLNNYFINSEIGQILVDNSLIIRKFSPAVKNQVNLIETDIGRSIADITTNIDSINLVHEIRKVISTHKQFRSEITTGNGRTYLMKINPYVRQDRTFGGAVVNFIDVTEVKNLNEIINGIFESSTNGITALRAIRGQQQRITDFEFTATNHAANVILGFTAEYHENRRLRQIPDIAAVFFSRYVSVVNEGKEERFEYYDNKSMRWFEVAVVKMMDGVVTTFTDITQKKNAADIITKSYEDLKITSTQLQETNHKLEQSNMDLLQFASVASHDLKEPLRKIQTFGNFLVAKVQDKLEPAERSYLDKIVNASHRMQVLIEDVLTLSKLSNKDIPFVNTDLNSVLRRIIDDLEISIQEKHGEVLLDPLPEIEAVPGQMRQLFQNLLANALKFNNSPSPVVRIQHRAVTPQEELDFAINGDDFIVICVGDNGIGFDEKFKEKIFGLFQRLNPTQYQGTGIGLAICKKIMDNHRGFIKAESRPGEGSMFMLLLPKKQVQNNRTRETLAPMQKLGVTE
jgi:two-component system, chemotaxis family, CheB/CheR fusion protein